MRGGQTLAVGNGSMYTGCGSLHCGLDHQASCQECRVWGLGLALCLGTSLPVSCPLIVSWLTIVCGTNKIGFAEISFSSELGPLIYYIL